MANDVFAEERWDGAGDGLRLRLMSRRTFMASAWRLPALDLVLGWLSLIGLEFSGSEFSPLLFVVRKLEKKLIGGGSYRRGRKKGYSYCNGWRGAGKIKTNCSCIKTSAHLTVQVPLPAPRVPHNVPVVSAAGRRDGGFTRAEAAELRFGRRGCRLPELAWVQISTARLPPP